MESINIFLAISKYPYDPEHEPRENQHTAFFGYILNNDKKLLKYLLQKLLNIKSKLLETITEEDFDTVRIQESESLDGRDKRPDMKVRTINGNLTIYIENKIDSTEGRASNGVEKGSQLNDYLELAKRSSNEENENFVLYLTKHYETISQETVEHKNFGGKFSWGMISDIIEEYIDSAINTDFEKYDLLRQFLEYMEEYGLRGTKGFKKDYGQIWKDFIEFIDIENEFLDKIESYFKNEGYIIPKRRQNSYERNIKIFKTSWNSNLDGFWIYIFFDLVESESESPSVDLRVQLCCNDKFYKIVKDKSSSIDLKKAIKGLDDIAFSDMDYLNPITFQGSMSLKELTGDYSLVKDTQLNMIIGNLQSIVTDLENSEMLKLLEQNYIN